MPIIGVTTSEEDKQIIETAAKANGLSASAYMRMLALKDARSVQQ